jgi:hypothetical protein
VVKVEDPWLRYTLRAVRGGLVTSAFIIAVVVLYLALPGHTGFNVGDWAIYLWAVVIVGILDLAIAFTGGARSELYLVLVVITVFLAGPAYPLFIKVGYTIVTAAGYVLTLVATGWGISAASLVLRSG